MVIDAIEVNRLAKRLTFSEKLFRRRLREHDGIRISEGRGCIAV